MRRFSEQFWMMVVLMGASMLLGFLSLLGGGCVRTEMNDGSADDVGDVIRDGHLRYAQDPATGHCFAYTYIVHNKSATGGPVVTWVPCDSSAERADRDAGP